LAGKGYPTRVGPPALEGDGTPPGRIKIASIETDAADQVMLDAELDLDWESTGVDPVAALLQAEIDRLTAMLEQQNAIHATQLSATEERGRATGYAAAKLEGQARLQENLGRADALFAALDQQAGDYLHRVERSVVTLALDLAHRVLHHEAQIDRLFLSGAVRMALEAMRENGEVRLRVPQVDATAWEAFLDGPVFENAVFDKKRVVVEGDPGLHAGQCICTLGSGILDLGARSQLGEVERSFEKVLRQREAQMGVDINPSHPDLEDAIA
jgi:flagellar biosynthesis/type III secretory pathway protein FliH